MAIREVHLLENSPEVREHRNLGRYLPKMLLLFPGMEGTVSSILVNPSSIRKDNVTLRAKGRHAYWLL